MATNWSDTFDDVADDGDDADHIDEEADADGVGTDDAFSVDGDDDDDDGAKVVVSRRYTIIGSASFNDKSNGAVG